MSVKLPWTYTSERHLLELVKQKRYLWDRQDAMYTKVKMRQAAFDDIAQELRTQHSELVELNGARARTKFKNLRTYFKTVHDKMKNAPSSSKPCPDKTWELYGTASFMADSLTEQTPGVTTYTLPLAESGIFKLEYDDCEENGDIQLVLSPESSQLSHTQPSGACTTLANENGCAPSLVSSLPPDSNGDAPRLGNNQSSEACNSISGKGPSRTAPQTPPRKRKLRREEDSVNDILKLIGSYMARKRSVSHFAGAIGQTVESAADLMPFDAQVELMEKIVTCIKEVNSDIAAGKYAAKKERVNTLGK